MSDIAKRRSIAVKERLWTNLEDAADKNGVTVSEYIRAACLDKLHRERGIDSAVESKEKEIPA